MSVRRGTRLMIVMTMMRMVLLTILEKEDEHEGDMIHDPPPPQLSHRPWPSFFFDKWTKLIKIRLCLMMSRVEVQVVVDPARNDSSLGPVIVCLLTGARASYKL